jgi:bifunctional non-homologous end joining protein LigD
MPRYTPMLAEVGDESVLDDPDFLFEPKLDGIRALCEVSGDGTVFVSRNGNDITAAYPELSPVSLPPCVLDGEIVLYDKDGHPDFGGLLKRHQRKFSPRNTRPVTFAVFDVLEIGDEPLISQPLAIRKQSLDEVLSDLPERFERTLSTEKGRALWNLMADRGLEGVIAKRMQSRYRPGARSADWLKVKAFKSADVVIIGFRADRKDLSSIEVAAYDEAGELQSVGRVGTGFSARSATIMREALDSIRRGDEVTADGMLAVEPKLVAEVRYIQLTTDKKLRHASFQTIRADKRPHECLLKDIAR